MYQALFTRLLFKVYSQSNQRGIRWVGLTLGFADSSSES